MRPEVVDPALLCALQDVDEIGGAALASYTRQLGVHAASGAVRPDSAVVFLHCDEHVDLGYLRAQGVEVNQRTGRVRTASVPLAMVGDLSEQDGIHRIIAARYVEPKMDLASPRVNVPQFVSRTGLTGRGVILGVIDTGIDEAHPAFAGRILRIWDQTLPGPGVAGALYGTEFVGAAMQASRDVDGHGTHVAGIAAGRDRIYPGIAPGVDLVIVKTDFQDVHLADAIQYVFRVAGELGRPAVVNMSLGGHADAHDGTDSLSQIIDSESGPGRIVCCAAGNEGNDNIHGHSVVPAAGVARLRFRSPPSLLLNGFVNGWYDGTAQLEVAVRSPKGMVTPFVPVGANNPVLHVLPDARVRIAHRSPDPANGDVNFWIQLQGPAMGHALPGGTWQLLVRNSGGAPVEVDVWMLSSEHNVLGFTGKSISDSMKIGSPGTAAEAITVAAYTTRDHWVASNGQPIQTALAVNDIADFSSEGPLRRGGHKPDVAAPGAMLISALSRHANVSASDVVGPLHLVLGGTSMATPFIAGVVALLLERQSALTPVDVKAAFRAHSRIPRQPGGAFDAKWGYGLLDAGAL